MNHIYFAFRVVFVLNLLAPFSLAQDLESMKAKLVTAEDTTRLELLIQISDEMVFVDADSAREYGRLALTLSQELQNERGEAKAYGSIGKAYQGQGFYDSAEFYSRRALDLWRKLKVVVEEANVLNNLGIIYDEKGIDDKATEYYVAALRIYEELGSKSGMAKVYNNLGIINKKNGQYEQVLFHYEKSLAIYEELEHGFGIAATKGNIGSVHLELKNWDNAIEYSEQAIDGYKKHGVDQFVPYSFENIGLAYRGTGQLNKAREYHIKALDLYRKYGNQKEQAFTLGSLAQIAEEEGDPQSSLKYAKEAHAIASQIGALGELIRANESLFKAEVQLGKSQEAMTSFASFKELSDSLNQKGRNEAIAKIQTQYETEKKEEAIRTLQAETAFKDLQLRQNQITILGGSVLAVLLVLFVWLYFRKSNYKLKAKMAEEKERLQRNRFKAVMDAQESERKRIAQELHDSLGQVLSTARLTVSGLEGVSAPEVEKPLKLIDKAVDEIRTISHNLMPNALVSIGLGAALREMVASIRATGKVKVSLKQDDDVTFEQSDSLSIYRTIQEVVNNSLKYASAEHLVIDIEQQNGWLKVLIEDDGKGFDTTEIERSKGIGWKNIFSRAELLNGNVEVDSAPGKGTRVIISIPLEHLHRAAS